MTALKATETNLNHPSLQKNNTFFIYNISYSDIHLFKIHNRTTKENTYMYNDFISGTLQLFL